MPAGPGEDAQRFAAAVEQGRPPGFFGEDELDRELEIVAALRSRGRAHDPSPTARALAKRRLMTLLAEPEADTVALGHVLEPAFPAPAGRPARDVPVHAVPANNVPANNVPANNVPANNVPANSVPAEVAAAEVAAAEVAAAADSAAAELLRQVSQVRTDANTPTPGAADQVDAPSAAGQPVEETTLRSGADKPTRPASTAQARRPGGRHSMPSRPGGRADDTRPAAGLRRRFGLIASAASVLMITLAGMGVLGSRDALPGQPLYGVKRVAESAGLALTFDDMTKAHRHLQLATTRLDEVEQLVEADPQLPAEDPELVTSAIREFDDSTGEGARILLGTDEAGGATDIRENLRTWAAEQLARLSQLKPALPDSTGADDALHLLDRVVVRTEALQVQSSCPAPTGSVDDLGPVPTCGPGSPGAGGAAPDPATDADPGAAGPAAVPVPPTSGGPSTSPDPPGTSSTNADARTRGAPGSSANPRTSAERPTRSEAPVPPEPSTDDTPDGALGGGTPSSAEPSSSPLPETPPDDEQQNSSSGGLPGLPPVVVPPLPGLPGLSL
jgi:Domain of unknown function (DUF5667)